MVEGNGIFLKDKSGNTNFYKDSLVLEIPGQTWDGATAKERTFVFTNLGVCRTYALGTVDENGYRRYKVLKQLEYLPLDRYLFFGLSETQFDELAFTPTDDPNYKYVIFVSTPKPLVVGNIYDSSDLCY
jgi:hypothetical protein